MMGIIAGFISYAATGKLFFGIFWDLTMTSLLFTITSVAFFVLLAHSVNQLSETY
jgi:membrane protein implicated in regulation of membrane protease activity